MTWPWVKIVDVADPIHPTCPEDKRPAVRDLIAKHRVAIDEICTNLRKESDLFDEDKHDDLWILRFVLSHKGHNKQALKAAIETLEYRYEFDLDSQDIREFPPGPRAKDKSFQSYFDCIEDSDFVFDIPHKDRGVVVFLGANGFDQNKLQKLPFEDRVRAFSYFNEWTHQWLDYTTRKTGRLTKSIRLLNVKGAGLYSINFQTIRLEAKAANSLQEYYPQMLESFYICDPPTWAHIPWKTIRPLLPARVAKKIDFVAPRSSKKERKRLAAHIQEKDLPIKYGGQRFLDQSPEVSSEEESDPVRTNVSLSSVNLCKGTIFISRR